jgi:hypothetical protein
MICGAGHDAPGLAIVAVLDGARSGFARPRTEQGNGIKGCQGTCPREAVRIAVSRALRERGTIGWPALPVIFGAVDQWDYILEAMGCGAAFLDYDNEGWIDVVILTGQRFANNPKEAIIRLYKNNRESPACLPAGWS